jgi:hypothetical protein
MTRKAIILAFVIPVCLAMVAPVCLGLVVAGAAAHDDSVKFEIYGDSPLTSVRGVAAAGNPWVTRNSRVTLRDDGSLDIKIRGLVVAAGVNSTGGLVPEAFVGTNPVATVRIAVTWMVPGLPVFIQETGPLPLDPNGDLSAKRVPLVGAAPPANAERPIILVRAGATPLAGPFIASSNFVEDFGHAQGHEGNDD